MNVFKAIELANIYHKGQFDKCGIPYIFHPLTVAVKLIENGEEEKVIIVAILHDIIEDSPSLNLQSLAYHGFSQDIIDAVDTLTRKDETYFDYIHKVKNNPIAKKVKLEDLKHNMNLDRLCKTRDISFFDIAKRYTKAYCILTSNVRKEIE